MAARVSFEERWQRLTRPMSNGCVEWTGHLSRDGYGFFKPTGQRRTHAHRWAYEIFVGPIPAGLVIDHLCRNRACVNPGHLEPVTDRENIMRSPIALAAINAAKTHCPKGHPLSGDNIRIDRGSRACKKCKAAYDARNYQRKKGAA